MSDEESITIYSDYVCPFCYLGRQSLDQYQADRGSDLEIDWHPFDLRADKRGPGGEIDHSVDDGKDEEYYEKAKENVRRLQEEYGVEMDLDLATEVDSMPAQVASHYVKEEYPYEQWLAFDEAIFEAVWQENRDVGDPDVIADLADEVGLDGEEIRDVIEDEDRREKVQSLSEMARRQGVSGVPTFVYEGTAARGAVPPEHLQQLVEGD